MILLKILMAITKIFNVFFGHVQSMVIVRDIFMDTFNPGYIERLGKMHL